MKYLALILFLAATSAYAGGKEIVWTSDTTYIEGGVECVDPIEIARKFVKENYLDVDDGAGLLQPGDYEYYRATEYDFNPRNPLAEPWMYCYTDWC